MADEHLLRRAAERAGDRPFYLASALLAYARAERLDDAGLAAALGCDPARLPALLLCRRPTGEGAVFRADVEAIATRFGLSAVRLAQVIRRANALVAFQGSAPAQPGGLLAAARDRDDQERESAHAPADAPRAEPADEDER